MRFSHPVDTEQFESRVSLAVAKDAEYLGLTPDSRHFTVLYDKFKLAAFIHSAALAMPRDDTPMTLRVDERRARRARRQRHPRTAGGRRHDSRPHQPAIFRRAHDRRRQRALRARADSVADELVAGRRARICGQSSRHVCCRCATRGSRRKTGARTTGATTSEIGADILAKAEAVNVAYVPSDEGGDTAHGFKFLAPVGRYLHVTVKDGVQGIGGYLSGKPFVATVKVEPYKRALTFLGQGALLSLTGDKQGRIPVARRRESRRRDRPRAAEPAAARRAADVGLLAARAVLRTSKTSSSSASSRPATTAARRRASRPTTASTSASICRERRAHRRARGRRRGLFLLHIRARGSLQPITEDEPEGESDEDGRVIEDTRLILVTDLGFIVKQAKDGSRDVFVQSIRTRPAGRGRARRDDRQQRPAGA